jgi:hypothetical protein
MSGEILQRCQSTLPRERFNHLLLVSGLNIEVGELEKLLVMHQALIERTTIGLGNNFVKKAPVAVVRSLKPVNLEDFRKGYYVHNEIR